MSKYKNAQTIILTGGDTLAPNIMSSASSLVSTSRSFADFVLACTFNVSVVAGKSVHLYRRDKSIVGANDAPVPTLTSYEHKYVGSFPIQLGTSIQYIPLNGVDIPNACEFYLKQDSGETMSTGYLLHMTPWDWAPPTA